VSREIGIDPKSLKPTIAQKTQAPAAPSTSTEAPKGPTQADMSAAAAMTPAERQAMIRSMVDGLAEKLKQSPDDLQGWLRLGRSRLQLNQFVEAKEAFANAARLAPKDPAVLTEYASSILTAAPNPKILEKEMIDIIKRIEDIDPEDGNVMWYLGLWEKQNDHPEGARKYWERLLSKLTPETMPWMRLKTQIDGLSASK
ncbi:MAG: hypothetical protein OQK35_00685, partial [Alphaproteobacteria bacterium]|nr:hypothetical protein [Alphaproteobacteria bacterium]